MKLNELALFQGIGLGSIASGMLNHRIVCGVESDEYCRSVLMARQNDGSLPPFPIWDDVRTFDGHEWRGRIDIVTAGFPCQPFSNAGMQKGVHDERNLWPDTFRIISEVRPRLVFLENVPPVVQHLGRILTGDLAQIGYDQKWGIVSASDIGGPHLRKRWWLRAEARCER